MKKELKKQLESKKEKKLVNTKWIIQISIMSFLISIVFSAASELIIPNVNLIIGLLILIIFILIGIIFDMVGVSMTSSEEAPFHSMNARKIKGANVAILFKKNADKMASLSNDVIGDICGIVSGSAGAIISTTIAEKFEINSFIVALIVTAVIAALTIGGKALGKSIAINKANEILFRFSSIISIVYNPRKNK